MLKDKIISIVLALIIGLKCTDLYIDYSEDVNVLHLVQESILILIATGLFVFLIYDIRSRSASILRLSRQLATMKFQNMKVSEQLAQAKKNFSDAVMEEFKTWNLSASEKDVCLLLIKGFSLGEIALLRKASEKTIRNQASAVYRKSGCHGRHHLAAHFFEILN